MKTFITATLAGISAVIISTPILISLSLLLANPIKDMEKHQARGSGRDEEQTLISSEPPPETKDQKPRTDIADKTRSGEAQTTQKESKDPEPHPRRD